MKTLDKSISEDYSTVKLYLEDLVEIERVLKETSTEVQFKTGGYSFDSVEELVANLKKRELAEMEIQMVQPYCHLEFSRFHTRLYIGSSKLDSAGLFYKLDHILKRTRRRFWFLYNYYSIYALILISITSSVTSFLKLVPLGKISDDVLFSFSGLCSVLAFGFIYIKSHNSTILLISRNTRSSFWTRKKDDILLSIISAILGAILGAIVTLLVTRMMN